MARRKKKHRLSCAVVTRNDVNFFRKHSGYIVGQRAAGALRLAKAERAAGCMGMAVEWEEDSLPYDPGDSDYTPREVLCAAIKDRSGRVRASLCGIADPDSAYRRVVEAELASEALGKVGMRWAEKRVGLHLGRKKRRR